METRPDPLTPARFTAADARAIVTDPARAAASQLFERQAAWLMLLSEARARRRRQTLALMAATPDHPEDAA